MSATDFFLLPLAFLISGLLVGWNWRSSRQVSGLSGKPPGPANDGEVERLTERLVSAVRRIETLERRYQELQWALSSRPADAPRVIETGLHRTPGPAAATARPQSPSEGVEPVGESEVSASQWRSAMDRLGPAWGSGLRPADPPRHAPAFERRDAPDRRGPQPRPASARQGSPLDVLFPTTGPAVDLPDRRETT